MANDVSVIRANNNPKFYRRFILLGIGALVWTGFCVKDGLFTYPEEQVRGRAFKEIAPQEFSAEFWNAHYEHTEPPEMPSGEDRPEWVKTWEQKVEENGWPLEPPHKLRPNTDIYFNHAMAIIFGPLGVAMLISVWRSRGRWIESDRSQITTSWGQTVPYDQVIQLNKKQWRNKGIAKAKYRDGSRTRTFVIDDYKFDRYQTDAILYDLEQHLEDAQIVGGPRDQPPEDKTSPPNTADDDTVVEEITDPAE